ncbi:hypothetical protein DFO66_101298 [Brevibacterium sanguinis]|uniref:Uncharacterized protein n=2 Tax=Brevibacterium TaxID=1696 RepID=A0A366IPS1_9MICO|nr:MULTISPECIES: hypothetical protein [Brevibacterium]RBP68071.1 hypothetical protein DFO66_101298 [Brevibacterium sanguinis]RBP74512.1 hypothetical protein DFO65_101231 [Brevibacterium celere]
MSARSANGEPSRGGGAGGADVRAPRAMLLVVVVLGLQAAGLVAAAATFVVTAFTAGGLAGSLLGLAVMFLIFAAGIAAAARGSWRLHRWARPAAIAFELLVILFGINVLGGAPWLGIAAIASAVAVIIGYFLPPVVAAYNRALAD